MKLFFFLLEEQIVKTSGDEDDRKKIRIFKKKKFLSTRNLNIRWLFFFLQEKKNHDSFIWYIFPTRFLKITYFHDSHSRLWYEIFSKLLYFLFYCITVLYMVWCFRFIQTLLLLVSTFVKSHIGVELNRLCFDLWESSDSSPKNRNSPYMQCTIIAIKFDLGSILSCYGNGPWPIINVLIIIEKFSVIRIYCIQYIIFRALNIFSVILPRSFVSRKTQFCTSANFCIQLLCTAFIFIWPSDNLSEKKYPTLGAIFWFDFFFSLFI